MERGPDGFPAEERERYFELSMRALRYCTQTMAYYREMRGNFETIGEFTATNDSLLEDYGRVLELSE